MAKYGKAKPDANVEANARFILEVEKIALMAFEECKIGKSTWSKMANRVGVDGDTKRQSSGLLSQDPITCKKSVRVDGWQDVKEFLDWHSAGSKDRRTGAVIMMDRTGSEIARFSFVNAWISDRSEINLSALADGDPIDFTFELTYDSGDFE